MPWFESTILKPIYDNGFRFESDQHISEFRSPVLIMHAENDRVVPYELGYKLYRKALESRGKSWGPVEFHRFEQKFGHKFIVRAKNLPAVLEQFINKYKSEDYWKFFEYAKTKIVHCEKINALELSLMLYLESREFIYLFTNFKFARIYYHWTRFTSLNLNFLYKLFKQGERSIIFVIYHIIYFLWTSNFPFCFSHLTPALVAKLRLKNVIRKCDSNWMSCFLAHGKFENFIFYVQPKKNLCHFTRKKALILESKLKWRKFKGKKMLNKSNLKASHCDDDANVREKSRIT